MEARPYAGPPNPAPPTTPSLCDACKSDATSVSCVSARFICGCSASNGVEVDRGELVTSGQATEASWRGLDASGRRSRVMPLAVAGTCTSPRKPAKRKRERASHHRL